MTQEQGTTGYPGLAQEDVPHNETYESARVVRESLDIAGMARRPAAESAFYLDDDYSGEP